MKKSISILLACLLTLCLCASALAETSATVVTGRPGGKLTLRAGAGTTYKALGYVSDGYELEVVKKGSVWSKVKVLDTGKTGYLKNVYIVLEGTDGETSVSGSYDMLRAKAKTSSGTVALRSETSNSSESLCTLKNGARLYCVGVVGSTWYKVKTTDGDVGFLSKGYVTKGVPGKIVSGTRVNIRKGAGTSYKVLRTVSGGTKITVLTRGASWSKVKVGSTTGYVSNALYSFS